jgi:hypothetical protein
LAEQSQESIAKANDVRTFKDHPLGHGFFEFFMTSQNLYDRGKIKKSCDEGDGFNLPVLGC